MHVAHYRYWWEDGRRHKAYVRRADLAAVEAACERWREADRFKAEILNSAGANEVRAQMRAMIREAFGNNPGAEKQLRRFRSRWSGRSS